MPHDARLAERIRAALRNRAGVTEKKMFGGVAFLLDGHMFAGVAGDALMARIGPANYEAALRMKDVREMDFTGKPMRGYVFVDAPALAAAQDLDDWLQRAAAFVATLPPKAAKAATAGRRPRRSPRVRA
jgi:TfoX/Sxy family transcriptional regulator of competence genes